MPVYLEKLLKLIQLKGTDNDNKVTPTFIRKPRKNEKCFYVVLENGKPISKLFDDVNECDVFMDAYQRKGYIEFKRLDVKNDEAEIKSIRQRNQ